MTVKDLIGNLKMDMDSRVFIQFRTRSNGIDELVSETIYDNGELHTTYGSIVSTSSNVDTWEPTGHGEVVIYID